MKFVCNRLFYVCIISALCQGRGCVLNTSNEWMWAIKSIKVKMGKILDFPAQTIRKEWR